jgi:hypothetical protein
VEFLSGEKSNLLLPVEVQRVGVQAVLDTASQVTVMGEDFFEKLTDLPPSTEMVYLKGAAKSSLMKSRLIRAVTLSLGGKEYSWDFYVAPISDDLLLGLDFLMAHQSIINLRIDSIMVGDSIVPFSSRPSSGDLTSAFPLVVARRTVLQPGTLTPLECRPLSADASESLVVSSELAYRGASVWPALVCSGETEIVVPMANESNTCVRLKAGQVIGLGEYANPLSEVNDADIPRVRVVSTSAVPKHLRDLLNQSKEGLSSSQGALLMTLLVDYQDVFAQSDTDLGCLSFGEHRIGVGNS